MAETRGAALLLLLALAALSIPLGRGALRDEGPPAFFVERRTGILIALGDGFLRPGIHQISDERDLRRVINLAIPSCKPEDLFPAVSATPLLSGECLSVSVDQDGKLVLSRHWIPAGQRVAIGIPLHPDRMSLEDWQLLPGVGPRLAELIESDRQQNGGFGDWESLARVKGVGPRRLAAWKEFFVPQ